jgi:serine/threonine-protein kinase
MTVLSRHVTDPPPPLASFVPGVPDRLAEAIDRCLAKDPDARYPSGEAFALAVAAALDRRTAIAVRAFVTEARQLSSATLLYGAFASIALPLLVLRFLDGRDAQPRAALVVGAVAIVAAPIAVMLARVRRLVRAGFGHRDLTDALRAELFHRREELAFLYGEGPSRLERASRRVCYLALAAAAGVVIAVERTPALAARPLVPIVWAAATIVALLAAVVARGRTEHRTDPKGERRLRFWSGPPGRWLFALAKLVTRPPDARAA